MPNNQRTSAAFRYARYILVLSAIFLISGININASQIDIVGPVGSGAFGASVTTLPNGNIVVADTGYDAGVVLDVGAVYLYNGKTGALISTITGTTTVDNVGSLIVALPNGNFVIRSQNWDGAAADVGAVTFCSGTIGCSGTVSAANSLVGSTLSDQIGLAGIQALPNGNYIVRTTTWDNGAVANVGAVQWCSGTTGCSGVVSATNSLIGSTASDTVGSSGITVLPNNNFTVGSAAWDFSATATNSGAVTFCSGTTGCPVGAVSAANSLVGTSAADGVNAVTATVVSTGYSVANSNYVATTPNWDNGAITNVGAVTWCSGTTGCVGAISAANSMIGGTSGDGASLFVNVLSNGNFVFQMTSWDNPAPLVTNVGSTTFCNGTTGCPPGVVSPSNSLVGSSSGDGTVITINPLIGNGNYVIATSSWDNGATTNVGAATWCSGTAGCTGAISAANSLIGSTSGDQISSAGITTLSNGHYVVRSTAWTNVAAAAAAAGAATWCSGSTGCVPGVVTTANSLVGTTASDNVGQFGNALTNGNYVIRSNRWDNGAVADAGSVTWCDGVGGTTVGAVSAANSLVGSTASDGIGNQILVLGNGNYVLTSNNWDITGIGNVGASTWCNGLTGCTPGILSSSNSLVGSTLDDGTLGMFPTAVGTNNYVVKWSNWDNGATANVGAATWCSGASGCTGIVTSSNSLVGATANDAIGNGITALTNGNYMVSSSTTDNGAIVDAGSVTWGDGASGITGTVSLANSLMGSTLSDGLSSSAQTALANGNFIARTSTYDNGAISNAGSVAYMAGNAPIVGTLTPSNSVVGNTASGGSFMNVTFDAFNETIVVGRRSDNIVTILNPTYTASASGNWSAGSTWNYGAFSKMHDFYIPNGRTVNLDSVAMVNSLRVDCTGSTTGGSSAAYIIGSIQKDYCSAGGFTYPVGTANGYSPVDSTITALGINPSSLTISAAQTVHPTLRFQNSLKRYWTLTETGDLTTDLVFHYLDPLDISNGETTYKLYRVVTGVPNAVTPFTLDAGANTISTTGISDFSDWAVGNVAPTASSVYVGGRVTAANGGGIRNVVVSLTDPQGVRRLTRTNPFGFYRFSEVIAGESYIVSVFSKSFVFANPTQVITADDNLSNVDFFVEPQSAMKR